MTQQNSALWSDLIGLLNQAAKDGVLDEVLVLLLTPDERDVLATRVKIVEELLRGQMSQRDLKERLNTGIATITRGSNSLKIITPELREWLKEKLL